MPGSSHCCDCLAGTRREEEGGGGGAKQRRPSQRKWKLRVFSSEGETERLGEEEAGRRGVGGAGGWEKMERKKNDGQD